MTGDFKESDTFYEACGFTEAEFDKLEEFVKYQDAFAKTFGEGLKALAERYTDPKDLIVAAYVYGISIQRTYEKTYAQKAKRQVTALMDEAVRIGDDGKVHFNKDAMVGAATHMKSILEEDKKSKNKESKDAPKTPEERRVALLKHKIGIGAAGMEDFGEGGVI